MNSPQQAADLLIRNIGELATPVGCEALGGSRLGDVRRTPSAALCVKDGLIADVGPEKELLDRWTADEQHDARGALVVPGFVDCHTHPVFAGTREAEFELRVRGASYVEISEAGGGILSSVRGVRAASKDELLMRLALHLDRFLELGTTTVEAKTGYGLSLEDELKCLEVLAEAERLHPMDIVPTFLGAHDYPAEYRERKPAYVELLVQEMMPAVAESGLAEYCDIFTESHVFNLEDSRRIMQAGLDGGLGVRMHVDQLTPLGGAELAAELGAASADHLEHISEAGIVALGEAGVVPVLCPLVPLFLRIADEAPARRMIQAGLAPAISTDFNPGSCYVQSMPEVCTWSALRYGLSAAEALTAATLNPAASLGRAESIGTLEPGKSADLLLLDLPNLEHLTYEFGRNPVQAVYKQGELLRTRARSGI